MVKYVIFLVIGGVVGYYLGNKAWRDSVNNWVKKMSQNNSSKGSSKGSSSSKSKK